MTQIEIDSDDDEAVLARLQDVLDACGVTGETTLAPPGDERHCVQESRRGGTRGPRV